jgi:hypothetical protein
MAFNFDTLALNVEAPPRQWVYTTTDTRADVTAAGYFARAQFNGLRPGDRVRVTNGSDTYTVEITDITSAGAATATLADVVSVRTDLDDAREDITALNSAIGALQGAPAASTANLIYPALDALLASAADIVDVFVYDTRQDSDGGAWTQRCQHTSWYNETLSTATRGVRREFPKVAALVLRSSTGTYNALTIYDLTDLDGSGVPRMWMTFLGIGGIMYVNTADNAVGSALFALNGRVYVTTSGTNGRTVEISFPLDRTGRRNVGNNTIFTNTIAQRNATATTSSTEAQPQVNNSTAHVHARVLPSAPLDSAGLPVPTIACATAGGVSVIHPNGQVYDITRTGGHSRSIFLDDAVIAAANASSDVLSYGPVPYADVADTTWRQFIARTGSTSGSPALQVGTGGGSIDALSARAVGLSGGSALGHIENDYSNPANGMVSYAATSYATGWQAGDIRGAYLADGTTGNITGANAYANDGTDDTGWTPAGSGTATIATSGGALVVTRGASDGQVGRSFATVAGQTYLVKVTGTAGTGTPTVIIGTSNGNNSLLSSGVISGVYIGQFTATGTTTWLTLWTNGTTGQTATFDDISIDLALPDRSYKAKGLIIEGSLSRSAVATGADLVAVSGFSAANYLEQPYNADLDYADADFGFIGWFNAAATAANEVLFERDSAITAQRITLDLVVTTSVLRFTTDDGTDVVSASSAAAFDDAVWHMVACVMRGTTMELWIDGVRVATADATAVGTLSNAAAIFRVGLDAQGANPFTGSLALLRITAYAPTPAQIRRMYEDERPLFQTDAKCFLGGTSNAVSSLSYDESRKVLLVGTGDGVSEFSGLRRVSYRDAAGTALTSDTINAVAGAGGFRLMASSAEAVAHSDARNGIDEMNRYPAIERDTDLVARGVTTDATPLTLAPRLHVGEREQVTGVVHVTGRQYGAAASERFSTTLRLAAYRDAGGNVTLDIVADDQKGVLYDTTGTAAIVITDETTAGMDAALVVDTTPQTIAAQVTGVAATRIVWTARFTDIVRISED